MWEQHGRINTREKLSRDDVLNFSMEVVLQELCETFFDRACREVSNGPVSVSIFYSDLVVFLLSTFASSRRCGKSLVDYTTSMQESMSTHT